MEIVVDPRHLSAPWNFGLAVGENTLQTNATTNTHAGFLRFDNGLRMCHSAKSVIWRFK